MPSSYAVYLTPSATWSISDRWNVNWETNLVRRFHDVAAGQHRRDWIIESALTVEYKLPPEWFGGQDVAERLGAPALDFQVSHNRVSSNAAGRGYSQWTVGPVLKSSWKF